jgi:hypothetical protein
MRKPTKRERVLTLRLQILLMTTLDTIEEMHCDEDRRLLKQKLAFVVLHGKAVQPFNIDEEEKAFEKRHNIRLET